jgi:hypothetical protein
MNFCLILFKYFSIWQIFKFYVYFYYQVSYFIWENFIFKKNFIKTYMTAILERRKASSLWLAFVNG